MRVLYLSTWFPYPPDNGSKLRAYHLVRVLAQEHTVTVVAFHWGGQPGSFRSGTLPAGVELHAVETDPFRYVNLPTVAKFASPLPLANWPSRAMRKTLADLRRTAHWDAVVAFQTPVAQYALSLSMPRILDLDTSLSYQMRERALGEKGWSSRLRALASWQKAQQHETYLVRRFQAVTVVSDREVDLLRTMVGNATGRTAVVSNGVDTIHNRPGLASPRPHSLVYNGALGYSANYDAMHYFLAEIYPLIKREIPNVSMTITGSTRDIDLAGLALDESVTLTGYVDDVRIPVTGAAVCVVPLRQGGGTRLKILEAMALGTPVVATSKGAEGLDLIDGEHCLIVDGPAAFAAQTVTLLRRADQRERLAANARRLVEEKYDWDQSGRQFVTLVEETVRARRAGKGNPR